MTESKQEITPSPKISKRRKIAQPVSDTSLLSNLIHDVKYKHIIEGLDIDDLSRFTQTSKLHAAESQERWDELGEECEREIKELEETKFPCNDHKRIDSFIRQAFQVKCLAKQNRVEYMQRNYERLNKQCGGYGGAVQWGDAFQELANIHDWRQDIKRTYATDGKYYYFQPLFQSTLSDQSKMKLLREYVNVFIDSVLDSNIRDVFRTLEASRQYLLNLTVEERKEFVQKLKLARDRLKNSEDVSSDMPSNYQLLKWQMTRDELVPEELTPRYSQEDITTDEAYEEWLKYRHQYRELMPYDE